ncbi:hypothetical protein [Fluviispira multicolorata]|uniref:Uncharacterized protein n=1 Tax=Fluviispira multicolorata TaxID=2654512 RepID=A0A833JB44_9BACT|nr:hypothetical protein [Fluviispira multicolorata]KAB8028080.1 hypothetical protein GCL57_13595 [Fluviispira multicolorata]
MIIKSLLKHNKIKINFYFIISIFMLTSCGSKNEKMHFESNWKNSGNWEDPNPALTNEINTFIQSKISTLEPCTKENASTDPNCALVQIYPGKATVKESSLGYRVMIIDDYGMIAAAYTRYRERVLKNIFENETTGMLDGASLELQMPRAAKEILLDTFQNPAYEKIPSELLRQNGEIFQEKFSEMVNNLNFFTDGKYHNAHSTIIFNYIANNSPNSQFVLIHSGMNKFGEIFCDKNLTEDEKINKISSLFKSQSDQTSQLINDYKIDFISYSRGFSNDMLRDISKLSICKNTSEKLISQTNKIYFDSFLQPLTTQTQAILVQANSASNYKINSIHDENFFSDCQKLKNRVRVGTVNDFNLSIPFQGSKNINILSHLERNAKPCSDIYINFSVQNYSPDTQFRKGVIQISNFNIGTSPIVYEAIVSSYATPVAVSYLIYLKMNLQKEYPNIEITNKMLLDRLYSGNNFIFDPSLHKQLPIYELGHLK